MFRPQHGLLAFLGLLLLGAAPGRSVEELLREGNQAFAREDYTGALSFYTLAEERAEDPGEVAYNLGITLYRLGMNSDDETVRARYLREAGDHFRRCQNDPSRRARALYGQGTCLLVGQSQEAPALREAIRCFHVCLSDPALAEQLRDNARNNLELAKLLWVKAKVAEIPPDKQPEGDNPSKPPEEKGGPNDPQHGADPGKLIPEKNGQQTPVTKNKGDQLQSSEEPPPPGSGTLPPVPDRDQVVPLSPEDAARHLDLATRRILQERRHYRQRTAPLLPGTVKDW